MTVGGYVGKLLRVDLTAGQIRGEAMGDDVIQKWVGGVGFGAKILWDEVPAGVAWSDPDNRLVWTTGPLAGSGVYGAATFNVAAKGPMTDLAGCSQANGFFGAYLKFSGFDGIVFQGRAARLSYLVVRKGRAELRDATHLAGLDLFELENTLRAELGVRGKQVSIYGIGPAGEHQVRHAAIGGDHGHVAAHNGLGAVMGSKNLKAVVAYRDGDAFPIHDPAGLAAHNEALFEFAKGFGVYYEWGTGGGFSTLHDTGALPVRNYTTNIFPQHEQMNGQYLRTHFKVRAQPCYKCRIAHVKQVTVTEGPYTGFVGEEPEYEQIAAWGPQIGNTDLGAVVMLTREVDRLGMDCNEASWTVGWVMECYEKGVLTRDDLDGLKLTWGNVEAVRTLLQKIAARKGVGDWLAEGVMRASRRIGGEAADWAIYAQKGCSPRSHDHRGPRRAELLDTCASNTSTLEATWSGLHPQLVDQPAIQDPTSNDEIAVTNARFSGIRQFDDCLGTCRIASPDLKRQLACVNAVTGWNLSLADAFTVGRRVINLLRMFNFRHGLTREREYPSVRYGSTPVDGPAAGKEIMGTYDRMLESYYRQMGWDPATGRPLPATLERLGLEETLKQ